MDIVTCVANMKNAMNHVNYKLSKRDSVEITEDEFNSSSTHSKNDEIDDIEMNKEDKPIVTGKFKVDPNFTPKPKFNILSLAIILISVIVIIVGMYFIFHDDPISLQYLKDDSTYSNKIEYGMSARVIGHHRQHWLKCSDFDYGCCEVNYDYNGHNISITLSVYKIVKHDPVGSNCPTIKTMIDGYNNIYDDHCSDTYNGCCMIDDYKINIKQNDGCPRERDIIHMYETNYEDFVEDYIMMLCILVFIICICCLTKK